MFAGFAFVLVVEFVIVVELPFADVLVVLVVLVVEVVFITDVLLAAMLVLAGLLVALLAGAASPQAMPRAPRAKTDESAITFLISKSSLLSSSKIKFTYFYFLNCVSTVLPQTQRFLEQTSL